MFACLEYFDCEVSGMFKFGETVIIPHIIGIIVQLIDQQFVIHEKGRFGINVGKLEMFFMIET